MYQMIPHNSPLFFYQRELATVIKLRLQEVRQVHDKQAENKLLTIEKTFMELPAPYPGSSTEKYISHIHRLLIESWSVPLLGKPSPYLFKKPVFPKAPSPRFGNVLELIPNHITLPEDNLIAHILISNNTDHTLYSVLYYHYKKKRWQIRIQTNSEGTWSSGIDACIFGIHIHEGQIWTKAGYQFAEETGIISPPPFLFFYGHEEARQKMLLTH
ncbi:hypothetical protein AM501_09935 [Aneurinibacillus migulanus]|uniref:hypothetical protein n=1 Tax=Aneurinibacillus migulanus TaxID=47500 RepID=UPI0005B9009F|nr:hypothetical protein [Aneurinibacillus migulanus]KIV56464.1 hypothetical protein TS64_09350 [Aneurinibacillus migulanus]KPD08472.1 hypothetical protein AM501_09935 [Aneurinibacillus migulanus]